MTRQRQDEIEYAEENGAIIIGWAADEDVRATKVPIHKRPALKEWINGRSDEFDIIVVWKTDRVTRAARDTRALLTYLEGNRKGLWSVKEPFIKFDPSATGAEKIISDLLIAVVTMIAEMESENTRVRVNSMHKYLRDSAHWPGGKPPYWAELIVDESSHKVLVPIPERVAIVKEMGKLVLAGKTRREIATYLNEKAYPPPRAAYAQDLKRKGLRTATGKKVEHTELWRENSVAAVLSNRLNIGEYVFKGSVWANGDGTPKIFIESNFSAKVYEKIQQLLFNGATPTGRRKPGTPGKYLHGEAKCLNCGSDQGIRSQTSKGKLYEYYKCQEPGRAFQRMRPSNCHVSVKGNNVEIVHAWLNDYVKETLCEFPLYEDVFVPGTGSSEDAERLKATMRDMVSERARMQLRDDDFLQDAYEEQIRLLRERLEELEREGFSEARWERRKTERTLGEQWEDADWPERRELLREAGLTVYIMPGEEVFAIVPSGQALADVITAVHPAMIRASEEGTG